MPPPFPALNAYPSALSLNCTNPSPIKYLLCDFKSPPDQKYTLVNAIFKLKTYFISSTHYPFDYATIESNRFF